MQGVSINIFVKTGKKKPDEFGEVFHYELYGKRINKYDKLINYSVENIDWEKILLEFPNYYFVVKNFEGRNVYKDGLKVDELFPIYSSGIKTHDDNNLISFCKFDANNQKYYYRPFDMRNINYDLNKVKRHRFSVMRHVLENNLCLLFPRQAITERFGFFISKGLTDVNYTGSAGQFGAGLTFPLYTYPDTQSQLQFDQSTKRTPNLNSIIIEKIGIQTELTFTNEKEPTENTFAPIDILDYIYAVLHSPSYREKYKEFLKIDFPRVPYPKDRDTFWQLVKLGGELRQIHLLESPAVDNFITRYPVDGSNIVEKVTFEIYNYDTEIPDENGVRHYPDYLGAVYINDHQYFADVPLSAWNFYIGGYQPAQKWLKDRRTRTFSFDDILHYQKIIVALTETARIMSEIDKIEIG